MPLFERYVAVDWSANNTPKIGADSIWSCIGSRTSGDVVAANHATRRAAESWLTGLLVAAVAAGERILVGMDFPYGYPAGFAAALGLDGAPWRATWTYLTQLVLDDEGNRSNRFQVASEINRRLGPAAPFWGRPAHQLVPYLPSRKEVNSTDAHGVGGLAEWRHVERLLRQRGAHPQAAWKLAYTGSVGSQMLLGIPVLERLRDHDALRAVSRVWPFEVLVPNRPSGSAAVIHAEIWPSIVPFSHEPGSCNDERQVRAVVRTWRALDSDDRLAEWFAAPISDAAQAEEGWVLGVLAPGAEQSFRRSRVRLPPPTSSWARNP